MNIENEKMLMWENGNHLGYAHLAKPPSLKRLSKPLPTVAEKKGMSAEKSPMFSKNFQ